MTVDWPRVKLGYLIREAGGSTPSKSNEDFWGGDIPWVSPKDMKDELIGDSQDHVTADAVTGSSLRMIPPGSILMVVRGMILAHTVPVAETTAPVTLNQDMKALLPSKRVFPRFLRYSLKASQRDLLSLVEVAGHGTCCLRSEQWRKYEVPVPPLPTQRAIADFLDRKTAAIDALIEKKERLLELLAEKRAALIHRAVTKGLDPSVPMKDSGVPWIGEIPGHWDAALLRLLARIESGHTPSRSHPEYWVLEECTIPWFSLGDVWQLRDGRRKFLGQTAELISPTGMANSAARLLPAGTVVLSRTASVGFSGIMDRPMATTQDFVNWVCGHRLKPTYLMWMFRSMKPEFDRLMQGSTHQTIYMPDVRQFQGPVPPVAEQEVIADYLDRAANETDALVDANRRHVALLREYRQALITAAVTGQLDIPDTTDRGTLPTQPVPTGARP